MDAGNGCGRQLLKWLIVIFVGGLLLPFVCSMTLIGTAGLVHDEAPDWYNQKMAEWLGLGCTMEYGLSPEDEARLGSDASSVAYAEAAQGWCSKFGVNIDTGIMLAIFQKETGSGANYGNCSGLEAARNFGGNQAYYAQAMLTYWRVHNTRATDPMAAKYIKADYSDYTGHCSAGEIGSGFIPQTAYTVCNQGLSSSGDTDIRVCNFWSTKVTFHAIAYWLYRIGYSADLSYDRKLEELYGWNHSLNFRESLLSLAAQYNGNVSGIGSLSSSSGLFRVDEPGKSFSGDLRWSIIEVLDSVGLLPEVSGWLEAPLRPEDILHISQEWNPPEHPGIDFACNAGADIIAVALGEVIEPSRGVGVDPGWGNKVWIYHGGGIYTVYAHMQKVYVTDGQQVEQGQVLGTCGSTGNSSGPHVHFGVANKHPDDFSYRQINPGWVDPNLYLGTCGVVQDE